MPLEWPCQSLRFLGPTARGSVPAARGSVRGTHTEGQAWLPSFLPSELGCQFVGGWGLSLAPWNPRPLPIRGKGSSETRNRLVGGRTRRNWRHLLSPLLSFLSFPRSPSCHRATCAVRAAASRCADSHPLHGSPSGTHGPLSGRALEWDPSLRKMPRAAQQGPCVHPRLPVSLPCLPRHTCTRREPQSRPSHHRVTLQTAAGPMCSDQLAYLPGKPQFFSNSRNHSVPRFP